MDRRTAFGAICGILAASGSAALIGATALPSVSPYFEALAWFGWIGVVLGLAGLVGLIAFPQTALSVRDARPQSTTIPSKTRGRSNAKALRLMALCKGRTGDQCYEVSQPFAGERLRLMGPMTAAEPFGEEISVTIGLSKDQLSTAFMVFKGERKKLGILQVGDAIKADGRIKHITERKIFLEECQLVF